MLQAQFEGIVTAESVTRTNVKSVQSFSTKPTERLKFMTDSREAAVITEALGVIDKALGEMLQRELVSTGEVADLLLDVRLLLTTSATASTPEA